MQGQRVTSELLDRLPPQDLASERQTIGSLLLDPSLCDDVAVVVRPEDFYADANRTLYSTLLAMHDARQAIDAALLVNRLRTAGNLEAVGGMAYLAEVAQSVPYAANARHYAAIVARLAKYRTMIHASTETLRDAYQATDPPEEILDRAERALGEVRTCQYEADVVTAEQSAADCMVAIDAIVERGRHAGIMTGLDLFDSTIGGLFAEELTILAARPSVGKSALALQIADHNAAKGRLVYVASLEMSPVQLTMRTLCGLAGVDGRRIRTGTLTTDDQQALGAAAADYATRPIRIDRRPGLRVADVRRTARRMMRDGLALVVVDYLQLLTPEDRKAPREQQVAAMARGLKALARELKLPVLALAQLNRQVEAQSRPTLGNLRESGAIEQDADMVMFLHRPPDGIVDKQKDGNKWTEVRRQWPAELILEKNRNGQPATFRLDWEGQYTRFSCWAQALAAPVAAGRHAEFDGYGEDF